MPYVTVHRKLKSNKTVVAIGGTDPDLQLETAFGEIEERKLKLSSKHGYGKKEYSISHPLVVVVNKLEEKGYTLVTMADSDKRTTLILNKPCWSLQSSTRMLRK